MTTNETARIAALVGELEAESYMRVHAAYQELCTRTGERFFGGGGIELLDPSEVRAHDQAWLRPGLIPFCHELAGDAVCWDVRRGVPRRGARAPVVYADHEIALAYPFARGVTGAVVQIIARGLGTETKATERKNAAHWRACFSDVLAPSELSVLEKLTSRSAVKVARLEKRDASDGLVKSLLPAGKTFYGGVPGTHYPPLDDTAASLDRAIGSYEESVEVFREMVHAEGRRAYAWHLAAASRGLSDLLLRRGKYDRAAAAAEEAIAHYEPIAAGGDTRVGAMLAFAHRVVAVVDARKKRWRSAYEHADRALTLSEAALTDYATAVVGLDALARAWEGRETGADADDVRGLLSVATRELGAFADRSPPHAFAEYAARASRLAQPGGRRRARRK